MVETKGKDGPLSLEEIAALFDGQEGTVATYAQEHDAKSRNVSSDLDEKKVDAYEHQEYADPPELSA